MDNNELIRLLPEMAIFVAVAEEQNFSKVSKQLGVAASSISRSIHRLETALQVKLLERTTRQVRLSVAGQDVYEQCKRMLASARLAVQAAQTEVDRPSGTLRIAAPKAFAKQILTPLVVDFLATYPDIRLKFRVADHFIDPISDEVDIIFRLTDQPHEGLISKTLARTHLVVCASPDYLHSVGNVPVHPSELEHHQCLSLGEATGDDIWRFTREHHSVSVKTRPRFSVNHSEIRKAATLRHLGISLFPDFVVQEELAAGTLVRLFPTWTISGNYQGGVIMQYAQSRFMPLQLRLFVEHMVAAFQSVKLR